MLFLTNRILSTNLLFSNSGVIFPFISDFVIKHIAKKLYTYFHLRLSLTVEFESEGRLPFLDSMIIKDNLTFVTDWYFKPCAANRITNFFSNHHKKTKKLLFSRWDG